MVLAVLDQADDRGQVTFHPHLSADGIGSPEEPPREGLVDDDYHGRVNRVALGEVTAFEHPDTQQLEISRRNRGAVDHHLLVRRGNVALNLQLVPRDRSSSARRGHGRDIRVTHSDHTRHRLQPAAQIAAELPLLAGRVAGVGEIELRHGHVGPVEAGLDAAGVSETPPEKSRPDQSHHRQGHLRRHQHVAQPERTRPRAASSPALLQRFAQARAGRHHRRRRARDQRGQDRDRHGKPQGGKVQPAAQI